MNTEQVNDTSRLDAWLNIQRERERAWNQAHVYQARAESNRQLWKPLLAGAAGAAMVVAAVWVAMPKFMVRDIEVPHIVQHDVVIEAPRAPMPTPNLVDRPAVDPSPSSVLPSKIPTAQEQDFVNQPDYQTAEFHGRIVGPSKDGGFVFDTGQKMRPGKIVNGKVAADNSVVEVVEPFIGDYAFCKRNVVDERVDCRVIHNGVVQKIPRKAAPQAKKVGANNPRPFGSENGM